MSPVWGMLSQRLRSTTAPSRSTPSTREGSWRFPAATAATRPIGEARSRRRMLRGFGWTGAGSTDGAPVSTRPPAAGFGKRSAGLPLGRDASEPDQLLGLVPTLALATV